MKKKKKKKEEKVPNQYVCFQENLVEKMEMKGGT